MTNTYLPSWLTLLFIGSFLMACEDETQQFTSPSVAQFESTELSVAENSEKGTVKILLSTSAKKSGELTIKLGPANASLFTTEPAAVDGALKLPITAGQSVVTFNVVPIDNLLLDGNKTFGFTIASATDGLLIGPNSQLSGILVDDETPAQVSFLLNLGTIRENTGTGSTVVVILSHIATATGVMHISLQSDEAIYGTHFTTQPSAANGRITLPVVAGINHVEFKVLPVNDDLFNGDRTIAYRIDEVEGGIVKGQNLLHELKITDDELGGTGKGYEIFAGNWRYKKNYEYDENGRVSIIRWEKNTPYFSEGTSRYFYNNAGQVVKVIESAVQETIFLWENGKIVRTEEYTNAVLTKYTMYGYDAAGNVGEAAVHHRQPDGQYKMSFLFVYLYKTDGNLYKQLVHAPIEGSDDYNLIATRTFDNYLDVENPFPMVEIVPNMSTQPNLPGTYRVEENGHDILYQLSYEFSDDGKPLKRTAVSPTASETAHYEYY